MSHPAPYIRLNGRRLSATAKDISTVLAPLEIVWGSSAGEGQPDPANAKIQFLFRESMEDLPDLKKGAEIEVNDPSRPSHILTGKVQTMSAEMFSRVSGSLLVTADVIDHTAYFENEYTNVIFPESSERRGQLYQLMQLKGWLLNAPEDSRLSARTVLNSIKLSTLLERYTSRFRGKRVDTSWRDNDGILNRQISVVKGSTREISPDKLDARFDGWFREYQPPVIDGEPSPVIVLQASNLLNDPSWKSSPDDAVTAVKLSTVTQESSGQSGLTEHNYRAPAAVVSELGLRSIDVETDLADELDWQPAAAQYFNDDAPWRTEALTVLDTDLISSGDMQVLMNRLERHRALIVIEGIAENRPDPGATVLRSYLAGGKFTWTGEKWDIVLHLERTILKLDSAGDYWTCEKVASSPNSLISGATCATVGDSLTVADFLFIGEP